jgi:hypothetical protein
MAVTRHRGGSEGRGHFHRNVFINCPFDKDYTPLLQSLLFTVVYIGLNTRKALESKNSGAPRIEKIVKLIQESLYAIHDLSRNKATKKDEIYRLNMSFELGLDMGCQRFSQGLLANKKCLILDAQNYRYQAALSDIAGSDIENHRNRPIEVVRNWLSSEGCLNADGPSAIWNSFNDFTDETSAELRRKGFLKKEIERLPTSELISRMRAWCDSATDQPRCQ